MSGGQVGEEGPGLGKGPPETRVGRAAAAGQVGVEQRIRLEAQRVDLAPVLSLPSLPWRE